MEYGITLVSVEMIYQSRKKRSCCVWRVVDDLTEKLEITITLISTIQIAVV